MLEDLPDVSGSSVLVRATFDRPLADDPARPLAQRRAQGLAATVDWLRVKGAIVTVCGDTSTADDDSPERQLERVRVALEHASPTLAGAGDSLALLSSTEEEEALSRLVAAHDLFVNDTLQDSFLPLPSLMVPPEQLPAAIGRTLERDLSILDALATPLRPFVAVLGGERSFERLHGLQGLVLRADVVLLGGALALPMLQALGTLPGEGATDTFLWECRSIAGLSQRVRHQLALPVDLVWRRPDGSSEAAPATRRAGDDVVDIGPLTRVRFSEVVRGARSILWAGALGMVEDPAFRAGTQAVAESFPADAAIVLGGDALVTTLATAHLIPRAAEMLSATDAAVELLKIGDLPALAALRRR